MNLFKRMRSFFKKKDVKLQKVEKRIEKEVLYDREIVSKIHIATIVKPKKVNDSKTKQDNKRGTNYNNDDTFMYGSTVGISSTSTDDSSSCSNHSSYDSGSSCGGD
ncbi:hypothetical protein [Bacillus mycoides]|uniref:hypothetical protein n=1 Tax=Bacillus mycoides TaxID=1405 RepID=UPI002113492E|nr:hypothetical protein [Bacillus mycoides]MCQ6530597.1 hypothetical protein [Bacillus mycoides]